MKALFVALAFPGFVLLCATIAAMPLRRTRRFAPYLAAPGGWLSGTAQILAGATGIGTWLNTLAGAAGVAAATLGTVALIVWHEAERRWWGT